MQRIIIYNCLEYLKSYNCQQIIRLNIWNCLTVQTNGYCITSWELMVFHRNLSDSKSHQVSKTLLSVLANLKKAVVCMVLDCPLIPDISSLLTKPLGIIPNAPIGITATFIFHSVFSSLVKSKYLSLFYFLWFLLCGWLGRQSPLFGWFSFFFFVNFH